ncbi:hypothetical protein ACFL4N_03815 [Thermodesulfobacteriota bacterium]
MKVEPQTLPELYQDARREVYAALAKKPRENKPVAPVSKGSLPDCVQHILSALPKTDNTTFNKLTLILVTALQRAGFTLAQAEEIAQPFLEGYTASTSYPTAGARIAHFSQEWGYTKDNPEYYFACPFVKGLGLPGNAFECKNCSWLEGEAPPVEKEEKKAVDTNQPEGETAGKKQPTQSEILMQIAEEKMELFKTREGQVYAEFEVDGHRELWNVESRDFRKYWSGEFFDREGKGPNAAAIADTLTVLQGQALFGGRPEIEVHLRIAKHEGVVYIDLVNDKWEAVRIGPEGWSVTTNPPVFFKRNQGMLPLPHPRTDGDIRDLRDFINIPSEQGDGTWRLMISWLIQTLNPKGPYPILIISGEQGTAKSTAAKYCRNVVDPNVAPLRSPPRTEQDLVIAARNGWVMSYDNLSGTPIWLSDAFCRISTGAGFACRQLYTDDEEILFYSCRPILLNGIDSLVSRQDLASRAILLTLPPISEENCIAEAELDKQFSMARPSILGGLCNAVVEAIKNEDTIRLSSHPRMADFAKWVSAAEPALPWSPGGFTEAYAENRGNVIEASIDEDIIGAAIRAWVNSWTIRAEWEGSASGLLGELEATVDEKTTKLKGWPKAPNALSRRLNRISAFMRAAGIEIETSRIEKKRLITVRKT